MSHFGVRLENNHELCVGERVDSVMVTLKIGYDENHIPKTTLIVILHSNAHNCHNSVKPHDFWRVPAPVSSSDLKVKQPWTVQYCQFCNLPAVGLMLKTKVVMTLKGVMQNLLWFLLPLRDSSVTDCTLQCRRLAKLIQHWQTPWRSRGLTRCMVNRDSHDRILYLMSTACCKTVLPDYS